MFAATHPPRPIDERRCGPGTCAGHHRAPSYDPGGVCPAEGGVGAACASLSQLRTQTHALGCQGQRSAGWLSSTVGADSTELLRFRPPGRARPRREALTL